MSKENYLPPGEREDVLREIEANKREIEEAQQSTDHQRLLAKLEQGLYANKKLYAETSQEVAQLCQQLSQACNVAGTAMLSEGNLKGAVDLLKRAEEVARDPRDKAVTMNNQACYYRRIGKLRTAAALLERALEIEEYAMPTAAAQTHLNLCAVLSQLNRHADALYHAQNATIRMYEILSPKLIGQTPTEELHELVTVLCIAYHNTAVEHEYLKNHDGAVCAYCEGGKWAREYLGSGHQLISILRESVEGLKGKLKQNSGAFKRVEEFLNGRGPYLNSKGMQDSHMGLLTPRDGQPVVDEGETDAPPAVGGPKFKAAVEDVKLP